MSIYTVPSPEVMKVASSYKKTFESVMVSQPAMLHDKLYKEVVFNKKVFGKFRENPKEYLYLDENNEVVNNKNTIERLGRLFFYMDAFFSQDNDSIIRALQRDGDLEKTSNDFENAIEALQMINKREKSKKDNKIDKNKKEVKNRKEEEPAVKGVKEVENTLTKLSALRIKNNEKLKVLLDKIEEEKAKHEYFNEQMIEILMPYYRDAMICNYEKIQLIASNSAYYNDIKKRAEKTRKSYTIRFNTRSTEPLMKLHYTMGYFENLLRSYGTIATMNYNQYLKLVTNSGKTNAEYKLLVLKNKVQ